MLGAGVGMLISGRMNTDQRRAVGWTLVAVGAITTIPILAQLFNSSTRAGDDEYGAHPRFAQQESQP